MKVLYLSAWYPTNRDRMSGLFVAKHAEALTRLGIDVRVVYTERTGLRYWVEMIRQLRALSRTGWRPDLIQLNVLTKNALIALYYKWILHIPYILVEHWSGYTDDNGAFAQTSSFHRWWVRLAARQASAILPVSRPLMAAMQRWGLTNEHYQLINNVVDDFFLTGHRPPRPANIGCRFLHVSCFDDKAKNISGILRAFKQVYEHRQDISLTLVGTGVDYANVHAYAETLALPEGVVSFTGELMPNEVAQQFLNHDAFVLFSNYENAPVVISEALATGTPLISSMVGGIADMVPEECGVLVPKNDEAALAQAMSTMAEHYNDYDTATIRIFGTQYSMHEVGQNLLTFYQSLL